jgi:hypothetical protein
MHVTAPLAPVPHFFTDTPIAGPALTSGFGAILEQEHELQAATSEYLGVVSGPRSTEIDRVLRIQQAQLRATIELLEQRYEMLPHPRRFEALRDGPASRSKKRLSTHSGNRSRLGALLAQQQHVLRNVMTLLEQGPDSQRGELMLAQVARNHEEMAAALATLLHDHISAHDPGLIPVVAASPATAAVGTTEATWENEGGPSRATRAPLPVAAAVT